MDMNEGRHFSELAAEIVAAYVSNNSVRPEELGTLIGDVHTALKRAPKGPAEPAPARILPQSTRRNLLASMPFRYAAAAAAAGQTSPAVVVVARLPPLVLAACRRVVSCRRNEACPELSPRQSSRHAPGVRPG